MPDTHRSEKCTKEKKRKREIEREIGGACEDETVYVLKLLAETGKSEEI